MLSFLPLFLVLFGFSHSLSLFSLSCSLCLFIFLLLSKSVPSSHRILSYIFFPSKSELKTHCRGVTSSRRTFTIFYLFFLFPFPFTLHISVMRLTQAFGNQDNLRRCLLVSLATHILILNPVVTHNVRLVTHKSNIFFIAWHLFQR